MIMDLKYILRRYTFAGEIKGIIPKINLIIDETKSMLFNMPPGNRRIIWQGPKGDLAINYYDSIGCFRAEIVDLHMLDVELKNKENPLILDLGANQGFATLWFKYNYPGAIIHAYEPVPKSAGTIIENVIDNEYQDITIHIEGISDKAGQMNIYKPIGGAGLGDSICPPEDHQERYETEKIKLINLDPVLKKTKKIDLLKIDVEGGEYPVLKNCSFWKKADKIIIEFHDNFKKEMGYDGIDFIKLIKKAGFKIDKKVGEGAVYVYYFSKQ